MTQVNACTVITRNRLAHARVLADSFLAHHPDGTLTALLVDDVDQRVERESFKIIRPLETGIDRLEFDRMATLYTSYELCNALKPWAIETVLASESTTALYLDSDMRVFDSLDGAVELAKRHGLVLTPHLLRPPPRPPEPGEEEARFVGGIYNAGFLAVRAGHPFLNWWRTRLARHSMLKPEAGFWVDQRWLDLVPGYFDHYQLRDPGCNVAPWNLTTRDVAYVDGRYHVDGALLRLAHFALFNPRKPFVASPYLSPLLSENRALARLYGEYRDELMAKGYMVCSAHPYRLDEPAEGFVLDDAMRSAYRHALLEAEETGTAEPPNPFSHGHEAFAAWLVEPGLSSDEPIHSEPRTVRSAAARADSSPPTSLEPGLNLVLRLEPSSDLDEVGRRLAATLKEEGVGHAVVYWDDQASSGQAAFPNVHPVEAPYDTTLVCLNPLDLVSFAFHVPADFFRSRHSIGLWLGEAVPAPDLRHPLSFLDEIWVASPFAAAALGERTACDIAVFPIPLREYEPGAFPRPLGLPEGWIFLSIVDLGPEGDSDRFEEANPLGLIEAFDRAFVPGEGPMLFIRTVNGDFHLDDIEELRLRTDRADIRIVDGPLRPEERLALLGASDCYVSLHRIEEVSLSALEALAIGHPVVVTGFSGNLPNVDSARDFLVGHDVMPRAQVPESYWKGQSWAEPDLDEAARLLRATYSDRERARRTAERAKESLHARHAGSAIATFVSRRLEAARQQRWELAANKESVEIHAFSSSPAALERALSYVADGPSNAWDAPSRLGPVGRALRRVVFRAIRPYTSRRDELDRALVEALAEINHRCHALEQRLSETDERSADH